MLSNISHDIDLQSTHLTMSETREIIKQFSHRFIINKWFKCTDVDVFCFSGGNNKP